MSDLALQNQALNNKIRRLTYQLKGDNLKQIIFSALCAFLMCTAFAAGTLDEEIEKNKEALKEFQTLSPQEQCIYLKLDDCDDL